MLLIAAIRRTAFLPVFLCILLPAFGQNGPTLFQSLPASYTGLTFTNTITENDTLNILNQANIYNGGGVGIGDFNRDGLPDVYFAGNMVSNKLYLNKGKLQFADVTEAAGVGGNGRWCTGVSVVDINADGWPDIYVSASFRTDPRLRTNLLYINEGAAAGGIPTFKESAKAWGIADTGYSTQGVFFDYDKDGDLDLYLVTNQLNDPKTPIRFRAKLSDGSALNTDRLYRNNGNHTFTNVSKQAGILTEGWGHAVCISDFNLDGWPDVYVANDFVSNDLLYINNKNGTFSNELGRYFKHTGWNAMGTEYADLNNDGLPDLISLEMLPEDNLRKKRMLSGNEYYNYYNSERYGYTAQYVRNVLQLNRGMGPEGRPVYSEVGYLTGLYETDWSWCPLAADFDNDGLRDLVITNGLPRDVTDLDYVTFSNGQTGGAAKLTLAMTDSLPVVKLHNYAFKNNGGLSFTNTTAAWGFTTPSFSNGAAYADLDLDGDLDILINHINDACGLYENTLNRGDKRSAMHTLSLQLSGPGPNPQGFGATVRIYYGDRQQQLYEHQPCRGYLSTVDATAHFGLGAVTVVDSVRVVWPDNRTLLLRQVPADQTVRAAYAEARGVWTPARKALPALLQRAAGNAGIRWKHRETESVDYNIQASLPHKLSQYGPGIAVGDIDGNGREDFFIGGAVGHRGMFFLQDAKGQFTIDSTRILPQDNHPAEDMGALFFDADNDGDADLYIVSGSYELAPDQPSGQDVLYFNDGQGHFVPHYSALPKMFVNGSCVRAADFDGDGDLDLFVGGRVASGAYPAPGQSYLLQNIAGTFVDATLKYCASLRTIGMVTDALWTDFDGDGKADLVVTGEWMPVCFFRNTGTTLEPLNEATGIAGHTGWWNSLAGGDFDNDGDMDYIAGNLGLNSNYKASPAEPMVLLAKDLDENGLMDPMVFCYMKGADGGRQLFPMTCRDDLISQMISIRKRFPTYKAYGMASVNELWSAKDREGAIRLEATDMASCYIENLGGGRFRMHALPIEAQVAPVYGLQVYDLNGDGHLDVLLTGNDYGMEPYSGRHDALPGLVLRGDGKGHFTALPLPESGFYVPGDGKGLARVHAAVGRDLFVATQNQDSLLVFSAPRLSSGVRRWVPLQAGDFSGVIHYKDGHQQYVEFYYGSSFLSQSSRTLPVDDRMEKIVITDYKGRKREVLPQSGQ